MGLFAIEGKLTSEGLQCGIDLGMVEFRWEFDVGVTY